MYLDELRIADASGSYARVSPSASDVQSSLSLVNGLSIAATPASITVGQQVTASFTVQNTGSQAVTVPYFLVGARDAAGANRDFPASPSVTLQPGARYTYTQSRTFNSAGTYSAWPAYYTGQSWVELGPHTTFTVH